jgi:preprotein translocase subunit SecG
MFTFWQYFFGITLFLTSLFLVLLILVQRGRGGGLAGALGGPGGQSAFGTKAGDTFTWVTAGTAIVWIFLSMAAIKLIGEGSGGFGNIQGSAPLAPAVESPLGDPATRAKAPASTSTLPLAPAAPAKAEKEE